LETTVEREPRRVEDTALGDAPNRVRAAKVRLGIAWLAVAWLVPVLTHVAHVDWLLPPLVLVATASLLRGGRTLLDRLMIAIALLLGTTCAAGLLFTVWPFGFEPVAVAGTALTVLGAVSVLTGRSPRLPRPAASDAFTAVVALGVLAYQALPYLRTDSTGRLALIMGGEDHARHLTIFDTLRRVGGYAYWQSPHQLPDLWEVLRYYPSGWHLTAGVLDGFLRSSAGAGSPTSAMDHYTWLMVGSYGLFALALLWAAQWIAGPLLGFWRLPLLAFLGIQLVYGDLGLLTVSGFGSEVFGLTALVLLVALLSRRVGGVHDQVLVVGASLVALGFGYELFLPSACVAVAIWALRRRRLLLRHRRFVVVAGGLAGAFAVFPIAQGMLVGGHAGLVSNAGAILPASRAMLLLLGLVVAAALARPALRRLRIWQSYLWSLGAVLLLYAGFLVYPLVTGSDAPYYSEKALHGISVVLLLGLGAVGALLPRRAATKRHWRAHLAEAVPAGLVAAAVLVALGGVVDDTPWRPGDAEQANRMWHSGKPTQTFGPMAASIRDIARRYPPRPGTSTVVLTGNFYTSYLETLYLTALQRTAGVTDDVLYGNGAFTTDPGKLADTLARTGRPVLLVTSPEADALVADIRRLRPDIPIEVVRA
jgi:hypothetical protein